MPAEHDGESSFVFRVRFSEEITISYTTLRDESFTVTNGNVTERAGSTGATTCGKSPSSRNRARP